MRPGPRRLLAVVVSALVGVVGGVATAMVVQHSSSDPLGLGIPLHDLPCNGQSVVVLGWGEHQAALSAAASDNPRARYLRTADSCATSWTYNDEPTEYAVYLGPMPVGQACQQRMTRKGDNVTLLTSGQDGFFQCVCAVSTASAPVLSRGMSASATDGIWIRSLQQMLADLGFPKHLTGTYDHETERSVRLFQTDRAITGSNGVVDQTTWGVLKKRACE